MRGRHSWRSRRWVSTLAGARLFGVAREADYRYAAYALIALSALLALPIWS